MDLENIIENHGSLLLGIYTAFNIAAYAFKASFYTVKEDIEREGIHVLDHKLLKRFTLLPTPLDIIYAGFYKMGQYMRNTIRNIDVY